MTVLAGDAEHMERIAEAVRQLPGIEVVNISDRTFLMHLGGKIEIALKTPLKTRDDLSMAYTPGVARVSSAIAADPAKVWNLTIKQNTVAVVSDGTAVLGLGDIGPEGALPVMEGKAMLFKEFGGVDAFPICLATKDVDEIVATVKAISPVFGGINLEDISAPRCFEIEERLREELDIPVFHDDQHGTAVVTLAALHNAVEVVGKRLEDLRVVVTGVGAAGVAVTKMLLAAGVAEVIGCDSQGIVCAGRPGLTPAKAAYAELTNPQGLRGSADDALRGADVFIGVSQPGAVSVEGIRSMAEERDRLRDGEPDAGGAAGGGAGHRRGHRDGTVRLPEPGEQRARLPRDLSRSARRARVRHHRRDESRRRAGDRRGGEARRARARLRDPERLQPRRRSCSRRRGRPRRRGRGCRPASPTGRAAGVMPRGHIDRSRAARP